MAEVHKFQQVLTANAVEDANEMTKIEARKHSQKQMRMIRDKVR